MYCVSREFIECFAARDVIFTIAQADYQQRVGDD